MKYYYLFFLIVLFGLSVSCDDEIHCDLPTDSFLKAGFYTIENSELEIFVLNNLSVAGIGQEDSLLYNGENDIQVILLPLSQISDSCGFLFDIDNTIDTIYFYYKRQLHLVSPECGFTTYFDVLNYDFTNNIIDSISVVLPKITTNTKMNVKIFF